MGPDEGEGRNKSFRNDGVSDHGARWRREARMVEGGRL